MIWDNLSVTRDLARLQEIAAILGRRGFGNMVRYMGLERALARAGKVRPLERVADRRSSSGGLILCRCSLATSRCSDLDVDPALALQSEEAGVLFAHARLPA